MSVHVIEVGQYQHFGLSLARQNACIIRAQRVWGAGGAPHRTGYRARRPTGCSLARLVPSLPPSRWERRWLFGQVKEEERKGEEGSDLRRHFLQGARLCSSDLVNVNLLMLFSLLTLLIHQTLSRSSEHFNTWC